MVILVLVLLGLALGSFVNALVWRLHKHKNWLTDRSECTHCHHKLAPQDLVPVISWLWLRGKCCYCHKPIDDSPVVELIVPFLFVISYVCWPLVLQGVGLFTFVFWLIFIVGFVALAVYDIRWRLLPDVIVFPLMLLAFVGVGAVWLLFDGSVRDATSALLAAALISGLFYVLYKLSKGAWIGFGDVKLGVILGLLAGSPLAALLLLFIASVLGMLIAVPMLVAGKATRKTQLPFGPLLIAGLIVTVLFGSTILDWYVGVVFPT